MFHLMRIKSRIIQKMRIIHENHYSLNYNPNCYNQNPNCYRIQIAIIKIQIAMNKNKLTLAIPGV